MTYLLDANVFMAARNLHYGMDFCPAFWEWLIRENQAGRVFSIEKVGDEIMAGDDDLSRWASQRGDGFFLKPDAAVLPALGSVSTWVSGQTYSPAAVNTFLGIADYFLVAQALSGGHVVVTHEKPENSVHRIKIPSVCIGVKAKHMSPFEMLRRERARFVLGTAR